MIHFNKGNYRWLALTVFIASVVTFTLGSKSKAQNSVPLEARKKYLLLDSRIIESTKNAKIKVGTVEKHKSNPLFIEDKQWEMRFDNLYGNVIYDTEEKVYKIWYSPFIVDHSAKGMTLEDRQTDYPEGRGIKREMAICYATSKDGLTWDKPLLGLVDYKGSNQNNILWRGPHGAGIFKDMQEENPEKRYKMIFQGLAVSFSPDGIHWKEHVNVEGVDVRGDTHNNAFWAPTLNKFVGITRTRSEKIGREVARIESNDFVNWSKEEIVLQGLDINLQTYAMPVFFYEGVYLGLLAIHQQDSDRVWTELTWSPDTKKWYRIDPGNPLIPCSDKILDYDYGCIYACAYPVFKENEIQIYYGGSDYLHFGWRNGSLCLATLNLDGFAGYVQESGTETAIITTRLLPYTGNGIKINADVLPDGSIDVEILDEDIKKIASSETVTKSVQYKNIILNRKVKDSLIQLRFKLNKAKLYSFSID
jgi:hypothetical protein